jgi:hypothetical protein
MSKGGKFYERTKETAEAVGFYNNMCKLIPAVRAAHIQVFIVPHHRWRERGYRGWKFIFKHTSTLLFIYIGYSSLHCNFVDFVLSLQRNNNNIAI